VQPLNEQVERALVRERLMASLAAGFGILGLAPRRTEIGVRPALGTIGREVLWMVIRHVLVLLGMGVAIGIPVACAASRFVSSIALWSEGGRPVDHRPCRAYPYGRRACGRIPDRVVSTASIPWWPCATNNSWTCHACINSRLRRSKSRSVQPSASCSHAGKPSAIRTALPSRTSNTSLGGVSDRELS